VRVRDHVVLSTTGAALLWPWLAGQVLPAWAASILIDVDHYAWFIVRHRRVNPIAAVRFFNGSSPASHSATHVLHSPVVMLLLLSAAVRRRSLLPVLLGMAFHVGLDWSHEARLSRARAVVLRASESRCSWCGASGSNVSAHLWRQPVLLPSYDPSNLVALCVDCHRDAHPSRSQGQVEEAPR
jgi:hypothetical protein